MEAATGAAVETATGAAVEAATGAAAKVTAEAVCCGIVRGATEVAVVNGAWAEGSGRGGAGGTAAAAATGAAVEAATGAAVKVIAAAVCCGSVRGATEVAVVSGAWAECSGRSGVRGTAAAAATGAAVESCASWWRRAAIPEQERKSETVLFSYKFIRTLLALASKVAVGELVAIEVLMYTTVRSIKDGESEARQASNMDFIGGEARGGANGVVIGIL